MDEIEELPVEALGEERPPSATGDRLMVGLAALVLLSGLLIAGTNLLGALRGEATADASPTPTADASRTPRPSPTPRPLQELTLVPEALPTPLAGPVRTVHGWLEAVRELRVLSNPADTAKELARLSPGTVIMAFQDWASRGDDGWVQTANPVEAAGNSAFGWVQLRSADGTALGTFYPMDDGLVSGEVWSLAADPERYTAVILPPTRRDYSSIEPMLAISADGERWQAEAIDPQLIQGGWSATRGPSGWLAASIVDGESRPRTWFWDSADGIAWSPIGYLPIRGSVWFSQLVGSEKGYVLVMADGGSSSRLWFSPDGITWQEGVDPFAAAGRDVRFLGSDPITVLAVDSGFVAWTGSYDGAPYSAQVSFSPDGRSWSSVAVDEPDVGRLTMADAGSSVVAIAVVPDGSTRAWRSVSVDGRITSLQRVPTLERGLAGASVESLVSNGERAWALGYDRASDSPRLWWTDGTAWHWQPLPAGLQVGSSPLWGAARQDDLVVMGARPTGAGDNPIFWHLRASGEWVAEPNPIVQLLPDPSAEDCGPVPTSAIGFAILEPAVAVACHGDAPMTFVAWSGTCPWCGPGWGSAIGERWLTDGARSLQLSPVRASDVPWREGVLHWELVPQNSWRQAWVQVTGHYADPAAESCSWDTSSGEAGYYHASLRQAVESCRQRFVITAVMVVDGPPTAAP
ncbi:MAG TPA: hypothetical protein VK838_00085 [Candidatus Limnocylindrales bacterium]|nr:hypothetical protein [Candidatus Limnocylindrales bacterium]